MKLGSSAILRIASIAAYSVALALPCYIPYVSIAGGPPGPLSPSTGWTCLIGGIGAIIWFPNPLLLLAWVMPRKAAWAGFLLSLLAIAIPLYFLCTEPQTFLTGALVWTASMGLCMQSHLVTLSKNRRHKVRVATKVPVKVESPRTALLESLS